jgi:hypothetical protein
MTWIEDAFESGKYRALAERVLKKEQMRRLAISALRHQLTQKDLETCRSSSGSVTLIKLLAGCPDVQAANLLGDELMEAVAELIEKDII